MGSGEDSVFVAQDGPSVGGAQRATDGHLSPKIETLVDGSVVIDLTSSAVVDLTGSGSPPRQAVDYERPFRLREASPSRWRWFHRTGKVMTDYFISVVGLVLLAPVLLGIAVAIWIDDGGPILFLQKRVGYHCSVFRMVKFRTMVDGADESLHREHTNRLANEPAPLKIADDPRITRVGHFLRRWSLDELPNLFNVLAGQMSIVGPRPIVPYETELLSSEEWRRFEVKPGVTGLAQVNGRLTSHPGERASYDVQYVESPSFWLDLSVILRTVPSMLRSKG